MARLTAPSGDDTGGGIGDDLIADDAAQPMGPPSTSPHEDGRPFVAFSELRVPGAGVDALVDAFTHRLREVEAWPGFDHLEVWQDDRDETRFVMVSWWERHECFSDYMRSTSHHRSHDRVPAGPDRPRPVSFSRFRVVAR